MTQRVKKKIIFGVFIWAAVVAFFAAQWYFYDVAHSRKAPFSFYLGWSVLIWGVLTPLALWFSLKHPISAANWRRTVPLHVGASLLFVVVQVLVEIFFGSLRERLPIALALRHYFSQHAQVGFLTYGFLVVLVQFYLMHDAVRQRDVRAARAEAQLRDAQLAVLRSQLQPHFLFNTLQAATVLVHEDPDGAEEILLELSQLLRASLDEVQEEIALRRELDLLRHYLRIQQRRFGDRLQVDFCVEPGLDDCLVPALMLQPIVENAIRHGIGKHKGSDVITVCARRSGGDLQIEVWNVGSSLNDAPGRLMAGGIGLTNTVLRLEQLYQQRKRFEFHNLEPQGVRVAFSIPMRRKTPETIPSRVAQP
jgi:sensor histidine kinase YesM